MPHNLDDIVIRTGIDTKKLEKEIAVMGALQGLTLVFSNEGIKFALYGGTALNKIYFAEKQRLSYDLDIECPGSAYEKAKGMLNNISESSVNFKKAARYIYKGVQIDLTREIKIEESRLRIARSLLNFFDYPIASVNVPSYSLEALMAKKTMALLSRTVDKDIYDTWTGMQLMGNKKKYKRYLYKLAKEEGSDIGYLVAQLRYFKNKGVIRDDEARVDTLKPISLSMMVGDILEQYEELGI